MFNNKDEEKYTGSKEYLKEHMRETNSTIVEKIKEVGDWIVCILRKEKNK